ncbi:MAG TPA: DUF1232 domain-containing protein [Candidatus Hydrogenedentes bacterium]|nr:DUF1232 domain-containing protein [Candidatus Hydrogenedentota bacterium]
MPEHKVVVVEEKGRGCLGTGIAMAGILVSGFWLLNFSAGFIELPDNLPFFGNIDEAAATAALIACFRYLGIDLLPFGKRSRVETREIIDISPESKK